MVSPISSSLPAPVPPSASSRTSGRQQATGREGGVRTQTVEASGSAVDSKRDAAEVEHRPAPSTKLSISTQARAALAADREAKALDENKSDVMAKQAQLDEQAQPSALKSLAYGSLGLQSPQETAQQKDGWYTAGKWVAAALTVGGLVSLMV